MIQYPQFRSWMGASSPTEKRLVAAALAVVIGLVGWAVVPTGGPGNGSAVVGAGGLAAGPSAGLSSGNAAETNQQSAAGAAGAAGAASAAGSQGSPASAGSGGTSPAGNSAAIAGSAGGGSANGSRAAAPVPAANGNQSSCGTLTGTDVGVTPTQIKVAYILFQLAGAVANQAIGAPSAQEQQQMAQAVVDDINANGGVACRKLAVTYYTANPIDSTSTQNICLQIESAGLFAVIGGFSYPAGANDCLAQKKIPVLGLIAPTPSEAKQYYPYLMSPLPDSTVDYANAILGLKSKGWFTAAQGFQKLAVLEDDCSQEIDQAALNYLIQAGVPANQIVKNDFGCPSGGFASPSDMSQFATQDNLAHVTNIVVVTGGGSFKEFTSAAEQQGYRPHYLVTNYNGVLETTGGAVGADPNNFDGNIETTTTKIGLNNTPGLVDPATQDCIALFARHGLAASNITANGAAGGSYCAQFELFARMASRDPGLTRAGLAVGLGQVGRFNEAFPAADSVYRAPGRVTPVKVNGGDFWWTVQFHSSCSCWKVIDPTENPSFQ